MLVYLTINKINQKVYVGQKLPVGREYYIGGGVKIRDAVKSLGRENFEHETLVVCENIEQSNAWEKFFIKLFNSQDPEYGYNIEDGGKTFGRHTDEMRVHMSKVMRGNQNGKGQTRSQLNLIRCAEAKMRTRGMKQKPEYVQKRAEGIRRNGKGRVTARIMSRDDFFRMYNEFLSGVKIVRLAEKYNLLHSRVSKILGNPDLYKNWKREFENIKNF